MAIIQGTSKSSAAGYSIDQSIRFNSADSAYLEKTYSSSESTLTAWSFSAWVKRSLLADEQWIFHAGTSNVNLEYLRFTNGDQIEYKLILSGSLDANYITSQLFRDPGAWMHIYAYRSSTTFKLYINGSEVTDFSTSNAPGSSDGMLGKNVTHRIGASYGGSPGNLLGAYLAEMNFIPGTAQAVSDFGETNADTGQWVPKKYTGSYGTNGFYITGADSADLGADESGNNNDFTSSGLTAADQMPDTPTLNFCTWNPTEPSSKTNMSLQDGNLVANGFDSAQRGTIFVSSGKWYAELTISAAMSAYFGISEDTANMTGNPSLDNLDGYLYYSFNGQKIDQAGSGSAYGSSWRAAGKTVGVAVDMDNGAIWFSVDGVWQNSATISEIQNGTTTNAAFTGISGDFALVYKNGTAGLGTLNTGQSSFSYTQPTGFNAWSTESLPDPTIADPGQYFNTVLFTGNSGTAFSVTGVGFQPDFVWGKPRSLADNHRLMDVVRGSTKQILSNSTQVEFTQAQGITSFDSDGFTVGTHNGLNNGTNTYVAWNWLADNTSGSSNTDGDVTSTVSVNTTAGFSICKFNPGTGVHTWGHGLGVAPAMVIVKNLEDATNWQVYHQATGAGGKIFLNSTAAFAADTNIWDNTAPTSSVVTTGSGINTAEDHIAYCFAEVPGYSKFGSYTGSGSSDGVFVHTNFEVGFLMYKRTNAAESWEMYDNTRGFNVHNFNLRANLSNAEQSDVRVDLLSNGFKARSSNTAINASGSTYIYMAFASSPFKTATAQ